MCIATLTTVGYGDVYPIPVMDIIPGRCHRHLGVGLFALPAGILASGSSEQLEKCKKYTCQKCGHGNHDTRSLEDA